jgi:hypothetical protein
MKNRRFLFLSVLSGTAILALIMAGLLASRPSPASAQDTQTPWLSSAAPPDGVSGLQFSAPDQALSDNLTEASTPDALLQLISYRVTGSALRPRENDVSYTVASDGGCIYVSAGDANTVWNTPVTLPQGSHIDTLRMYYDDTSASNSSAWFSVYDLYGSIVNEWSVSSSGNSGNSFNDSSLISHTIDYSVYSYLLNWRPIVSGSGFQLCGFRIFYEPPPFGASFLPVSKRNN